MLINCTSWGAGTCWISLFCSGKRKRIISYPFENWERREQSARSTEMGSEGQSSSCRSAGQLSSTITTSSLPVMALQESQLLSLRSGAPFGFLLYPTLRSVTPSSGARRKVAFVTFVAPISLAGLAPFKVDFGRKGWPSISLSSHFRAFHTPFLRGIRYTSDNSFLFVQFGCPIRPTNPFGPSESVMNSKLTLGTT